MSRHPSTRRLALLAGGELSWWERFQANRHVRSCGRCSAELAAFAESRAWLRTGAGELPAELNWNRLAAEMKANIHLGLEAGEIAAGRMPAARVAEDEEPAGSFGSFFKPVAALASAAVFLYGATWMLSGRRAKEPAGQVLLATSGDGVSYQGHGAGLTLMHEGSKPVAWELGLNSSLRAQYVDEDTGQVTINHVYME
jgi:hypothetical protein